MCRVCSYIGTSIPQSLKSEASCYFCQNPTEVRPDRNNRNHIMFDIENLLQSHPEVWLRQ